MRKLDLSKKSNVKCEHCKHYTKYSKQKVKGSNPLGHCDLYNKDFKYWHSCSRFIWRDRYLGIADTNIDINANINGKYLCRRCHRPLTDPDSIARGFGENCYNKFIREIIRRNKRLF